MGFKDLRRILRERTRRQEETGLNTVEYEEMERAKMHLQNIREMHNKAYKQRKEKYFAEHPDKQFFEPTLEETIRDTKLEEWSWYFVSRIFDRSPEQKFRDAKNPWHGFGHDSNVHSSDEKCREGCRCWPEEGRIEDIEILEDYKDYDRYQEVLEIWTEQ